MNKKRMTWAGIIFILFGMGNILRGFGNIIDASARVLANPLLINNQSWIRANAFSVLMMAIGVIMLLLALMCREEQLQ